MKDELIKIIDELKETISQEGLQILDKDLLEFSIRILNTNQINNKPKPFYPRNEFKSDSKTNPLTSQEQPATDKQKYLIQKFGKVIPAGLSKAEAMKIIQNLKQE
jgi:hypothetical protein